MATDLGLPITDLYEAAAEIRHFIHSIDDSALLFAEVELSPQATATTWYYVVGPDSRIYRVPAALGEALVLGRDEVDAAVRPEWKHANGGVAVVGVVAILENRRPVFIERFGPKVQIKTNAATDIRFELTSGTLMALAEEVNRRAKVPQRAVGYLATFLSVTRGRLPCEVGAQLGVASREAHKFSADQLAKDKETLMWDLWKSRPVKRIR